MTSIGVCLRSCLVAFGLTAVLAVPAAAQVATGNANAEPSADRSSIYSRDKGSNESGAVARCRPLSGDYQAACGARVMGFGKASGSVGGGELPPKVEIVVVRPEADRVRVEPQTSNPVVLVPVPVPVK